MVAVAGSACGNKPQSGHCPRSVLACLGIGWVPHLRCGRESVRPGLVLASQASLCPGPSPGWPRSLTPS